MLCSAMNYGMVRTILNGAISSPAEADLPTLDEAIRWLECGGTILQLDRGTDRDVAVSHRPKQPSFERMFSILLLTTCFRPQRSVLPT